MHRPVALIMASLLAAAPAEAGTKAVYDQPEKGSLTVEIADNGDVRVGPEGQDMYVLLLGDTSYVVSIKDGKTQVARLADVAAAFDKVMPPMFGKLFGAAASATQGSTMKIEKIGSETVNGRVGTAYRLKGDDVGEKPPEVVMSQDPALAPVGRAMGRFTEATMLMLAPLFGKATGGMVADMRAVLALGTPLRGGDGMTLKSVETADVPAARVALPAKPQTVDEIVKSIKVTPTN
jgi:hypothetical protein